MVWAVLSAPLSGNAPKVRDPAMAVVQLPMQIWSSPGIVLYFPVKQAQFRYNLL